MGLQQWFSKTLKEFRAETGSGDGTFGSLHYEITHATNNESTEMYKTITVWFSKYTNLLFCKHGKVNALDAHV